MAHYIDKDALVAEIDKVMAEEMKFYETACKEGDEEVSSSPMVYTRLQILRSYIDTLEVKEVDFEQELDNIWFANKFGEYFNNDAVDFSRIRTICKHFFELGLKAQKGE